MKPTTEQPKNHPYTKRNAKALQTYADNLDDIAGCLEALDVNDPHALAMDGLLALLKAGKL